MNVWVESSVFPLIQYFLLDPDVVILNTGSVGTMPDEAGGVKAGFLAGIGHCRL
jgi:hypothetical protein